MKKKYNDFYYSVDRKIHPDSDYWELHSVDKIKAIEKYDSKMYCPLCLMAPLTVAKGSERKYFKVSNSNMDMHSIDCPYRLEEATEIEINEFYNNETPENIKNRLVSCINIMLKQNFRNNFNHNQQNNKQPSDVTNTFVIENKNKVKKYLPHMSLYSKNLREEINKTKLFYGKCKIYHKIINKKDNKEGSVHFLYILNYKTNKLICSISMSSKVYSYLKLELPKEKEKAKMYYTCFASKLSIKDEFLNTGLRDSRMLLLEEVKYEIY